MAPAHAHRIIVDVRQILPILAPTVAWLAVSGHAVLAQSKVLEVAPPAERTTPARFELEPGNDGRCAFRLPAGPDGFVVPMAAGLDLAADDASAMAWLRAGSPWDLIELPLFGVRYGARTLVVILPWPHYARVSFGDRVAIDFAMPDGRADAAPCAVLACWAGPSPLAAAEVWRAWRRSDAEHGLVPRPAPLAERLPAALLDRLLGAPHLYLWGRTRFSHHDVVRRRWNEAAAALLAAAEDDALGRLGRGWSNEERRALETLAAAEWPEAWLVEQVAAAVDRALGEPERWQGDGAPAQVADAWTAALGKAAIRPPNEWGDGASLPLLDALSDAGLERALLLTSDFPGTAVQPAVLQRAAELGYLLGPYDSYHSVHDPDAPADETWATAQFDREAFERGRVRRSDGSGHAGFRGRGFHFAPAAAWPYVRERVGGTRAAAPFSAWFVDCDATGESFDDYTEGREASRVDDLLLRRQRLSWLRDAQGLLVGSEGGSALFVDVVDFGHGVDTPYLGHLDPAFRDPASPHFLGRHWPAHTPAAYFAPVPLPAAMRSPWFDPARRIPLYRAALGDEIVTTHHWSFDNLKLADVRIERELLGLLTATPPLLHLSRAAWPARREWLVRYVSFWGPLHRAVGAAPLVAFEHLEGNRLVQRATFATELGAVHVAVNFDARERSGLPARSATVDGPGWKARGSEPGREPALYLAR